MKGWVCKNFIRLRWQINFQKVLLDHPYILDLIPLKVGPEFFGGRMIRLYRPNFPHPLRQSRRNHTRPRPNIEH